MFGSEQKTSTGSISVFGMKIVGLPTSYQSQILALYKIAREECREGAWEDIEPTLARFWTNAHPPPDVKWEEVAPHVRTACIQLRSHNTLL